MKRKILATTLVTVLAATALYGCSSDDNTTEDTTTESTSESADEATDETMEDTDEATDESAESSDEEASAESKGTIVLATTTSTENSGLLDYILPEFTEDTGWDVDVIAVGTGAALQMGRDGEADVLLAHAKPDEETFVDEGYGTERYDVMYNDFVIVGPSEPIEYNEDVQSTFQDIYDQDLIFVSRGDDSGTEKKELAIWSSIGVDEPDFSNYINAGQGMGATLGMTSEMDGYTLSDRATWLTYDDKGDLGIVCENSADLLNYYGVIPVSTQVNEDINVEGGQDFADWLISPEGQELIGEYGVEEFGEPLFFPNAS